MLRSKSQSSLLASTMTIAAVLIAMAIPASPASPPPASSSSATATLEEELHAVWGRSDGSPGSDGLLLHAASAGSFTPTLDCPSPSMVVLLTGHYRAMNTTAPNLAKLAGLASKRCCLVVALVPPDFDTGGSDASLNAAGKPSMGTQASWGMEGQTVTGMLDKHSAALFRGRLAYAVVSRYGLAARYPECLALWWQGVWAVAEWAARRGGWKFEADALVLRTRPDMLFTKAAQIDRLREYFRSGVRGHHLSLSRYGSPAGDLVMVTSAGAYRRDVAAPLAEAGRLRQGLAGTGASAAAAAAAAAVAAPSTPNTQSFVDYSPLRAQGRREARQSQGSSSSWGHNASESHDRQRERERKSESERERERESESESQRHRQLASRFKGIKDRDRGGKPDHRKPAPPPPPGPPNGRTKAGGGAGNQGSSAALGGFGNHNPRSLFLYTLGITNGWSYGRSISNRAPWMPRDMLTRGCVCLGGSQSKESDGAQPAGTAAVDGSVRALRPCGLGEETCLLTVVEAPWIAESAKLIRSDTVISWEGHEATAGGPRPKADSLPTAPGVVKGFFDRTAPFDLADQVHLYTLSAQPFTKHVVRKCWQRDRNYGTSGGQGLFRGTKGVNLKVPGALSTIPDEDGAYARAEGRGVWPQDGYAEVVLPGLGPPPG